jgi:hypothetical protein
MCPVKLLAFWTFIVILALQLAACNQRREQMDWKGLLDHLDQQEKNR